MGKRGNGDKEGLWSLIIGVIFNIVNCVMVFMPVYLFGGIFIWTSEKRHPK